MLTNDIPVVLESAPWFIPGTTDSTALAEQALTWLLDNPKYGHDHAPGFAPVLMKKPEHMADWLTKQRGHILDGRRRRAVYLALKPDDLVPCPCRFGVGLLPYEEISLSSCDCKRKRHPAFREQLNNSTTLNGER